MNDDIGVCSAKPSIRGNKPERDSAAYQFTKRTETNTTRMSRNVSRRDNPYQVEAISRRM
jgi:hypothetical protein